MKKATVIINEVSRSAVAHLIFFEQNYVVLGTIYYLDIPVSQKYRNTFVRLEYQDLDLDTVTLM